MKIHLLMVLSVSAAGLMLLMGSQLAPKPKTVTVPAMTEFGRTGTTMDGWDWTTAPWTENDAPYQAIVTQIEGGLRHGRTIHAIVTQYQDAEQLHSQDPLAVFAWASAKWRSCCWAGTIVTSDRDISALPDELAQVSPQPRSYNWARLRFLVQAEESPRLELQPVGERLFAKEPTDQDVQFQLVRVLRRIQEPPENAKAIKISQDLVTAHPEVFLYRQIYANCLHDRYRNFGTKKADAEAAIAAYQSYIDHAPSSDPEKPIMGEAIASIKHWETMDWPPYKPGPVAKPLPDTRLYGDARPKPLKPVPPSPQRPGEPMPSVPMKDLPEPDL